MTIEIKYDTEIQITKDQFKYLISNHTESCAFRSDYSYSYYFKLWLMKDASRICDYLNRSQNTIKYIY